MGQAGSLPRNFKNIDAIRGHRLHFVFTPTEKHASFRDTECALRRSLCGIVTHVCYFDCRLMSRESKLYGCSLNGAMIVFMRAAVVIGLPTVVGNIISSVIAWR